MSRPSHALAFANALASRIDAPRGEQFDARREADFEPLAPLSAWADLARRRRAIALAEPGLRRMSGSHTFKELPPPSENKGGG